MSQTNYTPPTLQAQAFNCPRCKVFAQQKWFYLYGANQRDGYGTQYEDREFMVSKCESCGEPTIWHGSTMIYPIHAAAEQPNADLPEDIRADFEEARLIANFSPRANYRGQITDSANINENFSSAPHMQYCKPSGNK